MAARRIIAPLLVCLVLAGCTTPSPPQSSSASGSPARTASGGVPALEVEVVASGLEHGWDLGFLPDGGVLLTERPGRLTLVSGTGPGATTSPVAADLSDVYARGEGGLLGLVIHPDFASSRLFTVCANHAEGGRPIDVRLTTWRLAEDGASAHKVTDLLTGLPTNASGRHSGCRLALADDGALIVGTGDTANGTLPQERTSLGGKTLRLDLVTGEPLPDNPFISSTDRNERYVYTYGHRNIQGVAVRPGSGQVFTAEHGPDRDDEVNLLVAGGNYGWNPAGARGGYDESVPMTDTRAFPDAVAAVWSSGRPTEAVAGAEFLAGDAWGAWDGSLAVAALKGSKVIILTLDEAGKLTGEARPAQLDGGYGRLRAARLGPDGALYLTTSNGDDDKLLRVTPVT